MIFGDSYKKAFENWWLFYFLKGLYNYTDEELQEYTNYRPGPPKIEEERNRWYLKMKKNSPTNEK